MDLNSIWILNCPFIGFGFDFEMKLSGWTWISNT